jgi:hypothetical protein
VTLKCVLIPFPTVRKVSFHSHRSFPSTLFYIYMYMYTYFKMLKESVIAHNKSMSVNMEVHLNKVLEEKINAMIRLEDLLDREKILRHEEVSYMFVCFNMKEEQGRERKKERKKESVFLLVLVLV